GQSLAGSGFYREPHAVLVLITPDLTHLRACVTGNQRNTLLRNSLFMVNFSFYRLCIQLLATPTERSRDTEGKSMEEVVTVANFIEPLEAEMARLRLESAGIETFLSGENARILEPGLGPLQLQVRASDAADARAILADPGAG